MKFLSSIDKTQEEWGIYIHIPYCIQVCKYCDFNRVLKKDFSLEERTFFHQALKEEMENSLRILEGLSVSSIYFGGGTPSLYSAEWLGELIQMISQQCHLISPCEITMEVDPKTIRKRSLLKLKSLGVNRLSVGVQSFQDEILQVLGRYHRARDVFTLVDDIGDCGYENVSIDLILGVPGQNIRTFKKDVMEMMGLKVPHVSLYVLELHQGTDFYRNRKKLLFPSDDLIVEGYDLLRDQLETIGIQQYEISNYARLGMESVHNLNCWNGKPYIGFGPGASSFDGRRRWRNLIGLDSFSKSVFTKGHGRGKVWNLSTLDQKREFLLLNLRKVAGFRKNDYTVRFNCHVEEDFPLLLHSDRFDEYIVEEGGRVFFSSKGRLVSNEVLLELFD